jgi:hypothetical protein
MKAKFKVGDKVKLRDGLKVGDGVLSECDKIRYWLYKYEFPFELRSEEFVISEVITYGLVEAGYRVEGWEREVTECFLQKVELEGVKMGENKMEKVAEILGVEIGEWFNIKEYDNKYRLTHRGLENKTGDRYCGTFNSLLTGDNVIIKKPWEPTEGETYYFVCFDEEDGIYEDVFSTRSRGDRANVKHKFAFKTREEAISTRNDILKFMEERGNGE